MPEALRDGITQVWFRKGIKTFGDLYSGGVLKSFADLKEKYDLDNRHFFKFFQIRNYIITEQGGNLLSIKQLPMDSILRKKMGAKGLVSHIYTGINNLSEKEELRVKNKWETDLNYRFDSEKWADLCEKVQHFSFSNKHILTQFNLLHRIYFTPERMHRIDCTRSQYCPRCKVEIGSLVHMFWSCSKLSGYWKGVLGALSRIVRITIPYDPKLTLLGDTSLMPRCTNHILRLVKIALATANKCIALKWKDETPPQTSLWFRELTSCIPSEQIMYNLKEKPEDFERIWRKLIDFNEANDMED